MEKIKEVIIGKKDFQEDTENKMETTNNNQNKIYYGDIEQVNRLGYQDYNNFLENKNSKQKLNGFNNSYLDIVDYILKITHQIWEEKSIGVIYDNYSNNVKVHTGTHTIKGINAMVSNTMQSIHAFPDKRLIASNVIWSGDDEGGFYSSHRMVTTGTNLNSSVFGKATGKKVISRSVADCLCFQNRIIEEWVTGDSLYIVQQLGYNPIDFVKNLNQERKFVSLPETFGVTDTKEGQLAPTVYKRRDTHFEISDFILEMYNKIWERRLFNYVKDFYTDNSVIHYIGGKSLIGFSQIQGALISLFACFPTAKFIIERVTCNQVDTNEHDVAVRWRIQGIHEGLGYFGKASNKSIQILGITHLKVLNERVIKEWITFDGIDILKQIYTASGQDS
ncbi:ester cyclase [Priestia megaterium]|uniref:nuclear transport factor 2 family protein n=1 Tax=Priestia megaterium TaxID=1404 RepID=UPI00366DBF2F